MPRGQGYPDPRPVAPALAERDESVRDVCRQALERLGDLLPEAHLYCHLRVGDALRVIAAEGGLRLIYEVRRDQGGICWRAAELREPQLVEDVRRDPDYMTTDERVRSEVAVPVLGGNDVVLVLDAEFPDRAFTVEEADALLAEASRLELELGTTPRGSQS
jgi:GAF domain-containing protein